MEVPTLQEFSLLSLTDCLINEKCPCRVMKMQWQNLIRQLDQGSWGDTSKCLLDRMVTFYGRKVTPILIEALLPINAKDLILKKCPLVTEECLNEIFIRCNDLKILNLTKNPHFKFDKLDLFNNYVKINCKLTTVLLKGCPQVNDGHIKALLKNAPFLVSLNIAFCNISDNAFLFNGTPSNLDNFGCKLETIDLSFCETFSSIGVHRLCSLCGQTLQSINLFGTKADATALLYLSGFGLVEAEQFLNSMRDVTDKDYEQTTKITNLTFCDGIFQTEDQGLLCFQHFLRSNRNVSSLSFFCQTRSENYITDNVLQLIGDHAENLKSLTVIKGLHMTSSGIARLAQCKQLTNIQLSSSKTIEDAAIIELVQNLNLSNIDLCFTSVSSASLNAIAAKNMPDLLQELEVSWCVHLEEDPGGIHKLIQTCRSMKKLHITNCCVLSTTLNLLAENCHNITELIFGTQDTDYPDESIILLSKNLRLLQKVYMGANPSLTNRSMQALITNCRRLNDLDLYGLNVTSEPFLQLITVPDDLKKYLKDDVNRKILSGKVNLEDFNIELSELPCLPHRSMVHCTELRKLGFSDCPFVEREELKKLATVATTSLKIGTDYTLEVMGSASSMQRFIQAQIILILDEMPGFQKNHTFFI